MIEAVIFDWAGTLTDFGSRAPLHAFIALFRQRGIEISFAEAREPMGTEKKEHVRRLLAMPRIRDCWRKRHDGNPTEQDIDELYQELVPIQRREIEHYAQLVPGTLAATQSLRDMNIKIGSTTGYGRAMVEPMLREAAQQGFVADCVVTSDEVPCARPAPAGALKNVIDLAVSDVRLCLKVDDTQPGIEEGRRAGMWTAVVVVSGNAVGLGFQEWVDLLPEQREARRRAGYEIANGYGAHFAIDSVADVPLLVTEIGRRISRGERP